VFGELAIFCFMFFPLCLESETLRFLVLFDARLAEPMLELFWTLELTY